MKNQFNLNIDSPCQEDFNQFAQTPNGGFCGACEKEVIDFTTMNDQDITSFFNTKNTENTCGRFNSHQLLAFNQKPQQTISRSLVAGIGLACLTLFTMNTAQAQVTESQTNTSISQQQDHFIVKGTVVDELETIPGVNIFLEGTAIGTQTDLDGHFIFPQKLKKGDVLVFSYVGLESQKLVIENKNSALNVALTINMKLDTVVIMGKVATKEIFKSNRNK